MTAIVEVEDLVVRYGSALALSEVSVTINRGEMVALIGPNGAGKTTFVKTVAGVLRPASGNVTVDGSLGVVLEGRQLFNDMTVEDNLRLGAWRSRNRDPARVYEVLPDLRGKAKQLAGNLSGGQQQMVAIGRALMSDPDVLLIDELSLGLAPKVVAELVEFITRLNRERGMTVLLIEQSARVALGMCDRAYILDSGSVVTSGASDHLIANGVVEGTYMGTGTQEIIHD